MALQFWIYSSFLSSAIYFLDVRAPCHYCRVDARIISWVVRSGYFGLWNAQLIQMDDADEAAGAEFSTVVDRSCRWLAARWFNGRHACTEGCCSLHRVLRVRSGKLDCNLFLFCLRVRRNLLREDLIRTHYCPWWWRAGVMLLLTYYLVPMKFVELLFMRTAREGV